MTCLFHIKSWTRFDYSLMMHPTSVADFSQINNAWKQFFSTPLGTLYFLVLLALISLMIIFENIRL